MEITCPKCGFSRYVPEDKIPKTSQSATCPKCKEKFRFRSIDYKPLISQPEQISAEPEPPYEEPQPPRKETRAEGISTAAEPEPGLREKVQQAVPSYADNEPSPTDASFGKSEARPAGVSFWDKLGKLGGMTPPTDAYESTEEIPENEYEFEDAPWEERNRLGWFDSFVTTLKAASLYPNRFFRSLRIPEGFLSPFLFSLLVTLIATAGMFFWEVVFTKLQVPFLSNKVYENVSLSRIVGYFFISVITVIPLWSLLVFINTAVLHFFLMVVGGVRRGFKGSFAAVAYSSAPMVLCLVPAIGIPISTFWSFLVLFVAFKQVHRTTYPKLILAWIVPTLLFLAFIIFATFTHFQGQVPLMDEPLR